MSIAPQPIAVRTAVAPTATSHAPASGIAEAAPCAPIHLHIDRLVVEGLPVDWRQGAALQAAVQAELARLLSRDGRVGAMSRAESDAAGGTIHVEAGANPRVIGREIGRRLHSVLHPTSQPLHTP